MMKKQNEKMPFAACETFNVPPGESGVIELEGKEVALFNVEGRFYAIANRCPHRGAPLSRGRVEEAAVRCPLHGWLFDLESGRCLNQPEAAVAVYKVSSDERGVSIQTEDAG
jgi:nitrite reductase (NADH) small subunit